MKVSLNNKNIYIVDDKSVCRGFKTLLTAYDFKVKTFNSAQSFFDAVACDEPGCLLLDIHMPGLDGWETQKKIQLRVKAPGYFYFRREKR